VPEWPDEVRLPQEKLKPPDEEDELEPPEKKAGRH
jgi:hypothetical protein